MKCIVQDCLTAKYRRQYCGKHYQRFMKYGDPLKTKSIMRGGIKSHPLYDTYFNMLARCNNPKNTHYKYYGGRGIKVCDLWSGEGGFTRFLFDMGEKPHKKDSLDRIDVNGDYSFENCRWADKYTQMGNTRKNNPVPGVGWHKQRGKWRARVKINGFDKSLGLFNTWQGAVEARNKWKSQLP